MGLLDRAGARLTSHPAEAEILVVNTCSFIDTAKQESVDTILEMAQHKITGKAKKLVEDSFEARHPEEEGAKKPNMFGGFASFLPLNNLSAMAMASTRPNTTGTTTPASM